MSSAKGPSKEFLTNEQEERFNANLDLASAVSSQIARRLGDNADPNDFLTDAMMGLADATKKFDPSKQTSFRTYAAKRVRGAVLDEMRRADWLPRGERGRKNGRVPEIHSTSFLTPDEDETGEKLHEFESPPGDSRSDREALVSLISGLNLDEKFVLCLLHLANFTMYEIAEAMKLSESRVSQIHAQALRYLKHKVRVTEQGGPR